MSLDSMKEIFDRMEQEGKPFWEIVLETDMEERQVTRSQSMAKMLLTWQAMADAADNYTGRRRSVSGLVGGDGMKMRQYCFRGEAMSGGYISEVITEALSMAESNACMCRIVAAPTAGACGVMPAVLLPLCKYEKLTQHQILEALYVASGIGAVIAHRACIAGASGGCQAEIGTASAMAAGALVALRGKHHGECEESQNLGLEIIGTMRAYTDKLSRERGLNYSLIATPAEGLSGRFVRLDKEKFGIIPGVTDREYYTNSFHVPVYYPCSAFHKLSIEAPYHALTNGGHISYVEMDGDPLQNLDAFEKIVRFMHDKGIGYGSINHPVDRDPVCGYNGIIGDECPCCHRTEDSRPFERIRRITGYLVGTLDRFNNAKRAEEHDRVKHGV